MTIKEKYVAWRLEHQLHFVVPVGVDLHLHRVHVLVLFSFSFFWIDDNSSFYIVFWYDFSFYFVYFFIVGEILQPSGGHVQCNGILIAGMAPDLSYDNNTRSERLIFWGMK